MAAISTAAAVGVTWITPRTAPAALEAFYRRVRPDGFWGRTAQRGRGGSERVAGRGKATDLFGEVLCFTGG